MADPQNPSVPFGGGVIPPSVQDLINTRPPAPVMGDPNLDPAMENLIRQAGAATELGTKSFGEREARIGDLVNALKAKYSEQAAIGPRSFQPSFQGRSIPGKIGEGLLTLGASMRPGQAVQDVIYAKPREEYAKTAATIEALQKQMQGEEQGLSAEAGMASRPIYGGARAGMVAPAEVRAGAAVTSAGAAQTRATAFAKDVQRKINAQDIMNQLNLSRADAQRAEAAFKRALPALMQQGYATKEDIANVLVGEKIQAQAPMIDRFVNWLNGDFGPTQVQAPGGSQPVQGGSPIPKRGESKGGGPSTGAGNVPAGTIVRDNKGVRHKADGTAPLPKGWKLEGSH